MTAIRLKSAPRWEDYISGQTKVLINTLSYVGEKCIIEARDNGSYIDQTGNLRSSIGYAVLLDGKIVEMGLGGKVKNGEDGMKEGEEFLYKRVRKARKKGVLLIVSAGMNYAEYVEARGRNVLTSAELKAEPLVKSLLTQLGFKLK